MIKSIFRITFSPTDQLTNSGMGGHKEVTLSIIEYVNIFTLAGGGM